MSKVSQKILTVLLVLAMLFGVCATTISAATEPGNSVDGGAGGTEGNGSVNGGTEPGDDSSSGDSYDNGWCKVEYEGNDITITLYPVADALLGTDKEGIKELFGFVVDTIKEVVLGDMLSDVLPDEDVLNGDITISADELWMDALDAYIGKKYDGERKDMYVAFLDDAMKNDEVVNDFAKYVCSLVKAGVLVGAISLDDLPTKESFVDEVTEVLDSEIDKIVNDTVKGVIDDYIAFLCGDDSVTVDETATEYMINEARSVVTEYISHLRGETVGSEKDFHAEIERQLEKYVDDEIKATVDAYIKAKLAGTEPEADALNGYIGEYMLDEVGDRIDAYLVHKNAGTVPEATDVIGTIVYNYVENNFDDYFDAAAEDYLADYKSGTVTMDADLYEFINDKAMENCDPEALKHFTFDQFKAAIEYTVDRDQIIKDLLSDAELKAKFVDEKSDDVLKSIGVANYDKLLSEIDYSTVIGKTDDLERADILEELYASYDDNDIVDILKTIVSNLKANDPETYNSVIAEVEADAIVEVKAGNVAYDFEDLSMTVPEVYAKVDEIVGSLADEYAQAITELEAVSGKKDTALELLLLVSEITVDSEAIYGDSEDGKVFYRDVIEKILRDVPNFQEIAVMEDDEMYLSYAIGVVTDFCDSEFNVTVKLGDGFDKARRVASIINRNVIYSFDGENLVADINVPVEFANAVLKACETGKIDDELKNRVFAAFSKNAGDIHAFLNSTTLGELLDLIDNVTLDGLLDSNFVSKFEKLDGLSAEEIKAKVREYEKSYNKALEIINKLYSKLPEELKAKTLFELYDEDADKFHFAKDFEGDVADIIYDYNEELADYVEAFLDNTVVKVSVDVTAKIQNVYKVTYVAGGEVVREGFLPVGADLAFFAGISEYEGETIIAWVDSEGITQTEMPEGDIVLTAVTKEASAILESSADGAVEYGETVVLTATPVLNYPTENLTYVWYKNQTVIAGATSATLELTNVSDTGSYYCVITVDGEKELTSNTVDVEITAIEIDLSQITEWSENTEFEYDGAEHSVTLTVKEFVDKLELFSFEGYKGTDADNYKAVAIFKLVDEENYVFTNGDSVSLDWVITALEFDESDLTFGALEFTYEYGTSHNVDLPTLPAGAASEFDVVFDESYTNTAANAGTYVAGIKVTAKGTNYVWVGADVVEKEWKINQKAIDLSTFNWVAYNGTDIDSDPDKFTFEYSGNEQGVVLADLPEDFVVNYTDNVFVNVTGTVKTASAVAPVLANSNYLISGEFDTQSFEIVKCVITITDVEWPEHSDIVYDPEKNFDFKLVGLPDDDRVVDSYIYYIKGLDGLYTETVSAPHNAGWYKAVATVGSIDDDNFEIHESIVKEIEFEIKPKTETITPYLVYSYNNGTETVTGDYTGAITYTGYRYTVDIAGIDNDVITVKEYRPAQNRKSATNVGEYFVKYTVAIAEEHRNNYELSYKGDFNDSFIIQLDWEIKKAIIDLGILSWNDVGPFQYEAGVTYKLELLIPDEYKDALDVAYTGNVASDRGSYTATAQITLGDTNNYDITAESKLNYWVEWEIAANVINIGELQWITPSYQNSVYNGSPIAHPVLDTSNISSDDLALFDIIYTPVNGTELNPVNAGKYYISAKFKAHDSKNYAIKGTTSAPVFEWEVHKADYNLDAVGVTFVDKIVMYDGNYHDILLEGTLPEFMSVQYIGNTQKDVGTYTVYAIITSSDPNYNDIELAAWLTIKKSEGPETLFQHHDAVHVQVKDGLSADHKLSVNDVTEDYVGHDFSEITPDGKKVNLAVAYDINFTINGEVVGVAGKFTVRLLIPNQYRFPTTRELQVVYIADDGTVEVIENAVRSGYYLVFVTEHFSTYAITEISDKDTPIVPPDCDGNHVDADGDGKCDICGEPIEPDKPECDGNHVDADGDGKCDICGEPVEPDKPDCGGNHVDENEDGYCDICGDKATPDEPEKDFYYSSGEEVDIYVSTGLQEGLELGVEDVTAGYLDIDLSAIAGAGFKGVLGVAYDINFLDGDEVTAVAGRFVVRLLVPEALRTPATRDLRVVYIAPDGTVTELESERNGDYMVFETDHFSVYSIVEVTADGTVAPPDDGPSADDPEIPDEDESSLVWLWIIIAVVVIAIAAAVIFFIYKKRGDNGDGNEPDATDVAPTAAEEPIAEEPVEEPKAEEPKVEEPAEEPKTEEPKVELKSEETVIAEVKEEAPAKAEVAFVPPVAAGSEDDESTGRRLVNGQIVPVRYRTSFMSRLIQSEPPIQDYYTVVKNTLLSYSGVKARTSWNFESFNKGRIQCAKLNVKGNAFQVYLGLDPNEYSVEKYHFVDVSDKPKLDKVPMMLKVKSDRALKYSLELIEEVMNKNGIEQGEMPTEDYHLPYETTEELVDRDLVKVILPEGMVIDENTVIEKVNVGDFLKDVVPEETVNEAPASVTEEFMHVDATVADTIMSDEEAKEIIEAVSRGFTPKSNKLYEVNIDSICENFEDGDTVDIIALRDKNVITKKADRVKVLARGVMTKRLTVVADKFSIQAVKMIGLAGGHAKKYDD